tara:strand:+ start:91 stop:495 length:405 start_codon:yes stop_codon:yes gene_type:complete
MNLVFNLDGVICTPPKGIEVGVYSYIGSCLPIEDTNEFMQWCKKNGHHITIWAERPNDLAVKVATETWLEMNQVPYDRLLFDRPDSYIDIDEAPSHAKFYKHIGDMSVVAEMYEEWKNDKQKRYSEDSRQESQH